jgi:hypothetical protein
MTDDKKKEYENLGISQKEWETKLEGLYEEWEVLSTKRP